ncbi:hypothetical protein [Acidihalobacter ferrooxydans]|uniref:hypothetical protein n=1 Tax=Acidihalobacter ferrooxydans TaxID=1765967 RepID=UPI0012EB5788|nr:hypothetical protein [Acidihalobacter ferrooxydans]
MKKVFKHLAMSTWGVAIATWIQIGRSGQFDAVQLAAGSLAVVATVVFLLLAFL